MSTKEPNTSCEDLTFVWTLPNCDWPHSDKGRYKCYHNRSSFITEYLQQESPVTVKVFGPKGSRDFKLSIDGSKLRDARAAINSAKVAYNDHQWKWRWSSGEDEDGCLAEGAFSQDGFGQHPETLRLQQEIAACKKDYNRINKMLRETCEKELKLLEEEVS